MKRIWTSPPQGFPEQPSNATRLDQSFELVGQGEALTEAAGRRSKEGGGGGN